ncbi:hypothetical protein BH10CHL1_BH10CHL1_12250 [soil metagenome]
MDCAQFHHFTQTLEQTLQADARVLALVAIGSLAQPTRIDQWSDHDFWVITTTAAQADFLADLSWLPDPAAIVLTLRPAQSYYTVLYTSGHMAEFAVFGPQDLDRGRLTHYRMLFDKAKITPQIAALATAVQQDQQRSYDASSTFAHFLITLCTGSAHAMRGEGLSAHTYIFQYALDALLKLIVHSIPPEQTDLADPFNPRRRFEQLYPTLSTTLALWLNLPPAVAAGHMLDLAERLWPDGTLPLQALRATRAYLQTLGGAK